ALSQAKNAADINLAKQIVLNTILASNETLEIKRQALALAGIPPIKMAVVKATQAMAVSSAESAVATNAASTAAQRGTGAFTTYGSAVRGAAGALGMLWFAYGQLLPLMAAFAIVRTGQAAVKMGMEFEYSAHMIQTLAKDVENATISVEEINQELLGMEGLRHGPLELAKGMKEFAKAGVAPKDALRDMATMSKFATIAEMDLGEAIKKVIGLTLAFKPTMEAATGELFTFADAANMTAAAAMLTITDVDEMANAFAYAAELGVVSGMKFQEVAAALGIMANAGIRGTKGATSLRMGMIKLQTPTDKALQKIKALNKEFTAFHEDGSAKNIVEVFRDLNKVLEGLPDKERVAIFAELFTARSLRAGAVISQQVKELDSFIKKLEEAAEGIGFIEEKYQDLGTTARAELEFLKVEFEKILLGMTDAGGIAEVLSDMTAALKEMGPGIILVGKAIGAVFHDIINFSLLIRKTVGENISFVIGVFTGENSISDAVDFVKARLKSFTDYIESWNIRQYFKENFEAFDRYTIAFASQFEKSAILIEKYWKNLNLYMKIIWGETINWIIDKLFLIPDNLLKIVNGLSELTKGVPGLNAYSKGMGAIGEGLEKLISGVKGFYKIDLSKERSELEAINAEYDTRIKKSKEVYQQLRDEHDALWNTKEVVDNLGESFGVLRAQMAGEAAAPTGTPWGYFFGAGGIGEFESVKEQMITSWKNLGDEAQALFDKLFPDEKQRRDYQEMLKLWEQQKTLGKVGEGKPISEAQYQAGFEALKKMLPVAKDGTKALDDYKKEIQSVVDKYLPLQKETNDLEKAEKQLHEARKLGLIKSDEDLKVALDNLTKSSTAYRTEQEKLAEIEKIRQEYRKWEEKYDKEQADLKIKRAKALRDIYEE
ncbi:MAG: phage tail tape measure protein, partial [Dehalococcoidales bacterium]|nr:phage tail tape measure protein [Dehalococcoidales bacterium]